MPLDPQAAEFLAQVKALGGKQYHEVGAVKARELHNKRPAEIAPAWVAVHQVEDRVIEQNGLSIPLRIYTPVASSAPLPAMVFYHGGGMVVGSLDSYDTLCRQLAVQSACCIISVDYRLAPENKFPAAVDDGIAALQWVLENSQQINVNLQKIAVGGDSAGASLAAVVAILARDLQLAVQFQMLIYPATAPYADSKSQLNYAQGYYLERPTMLWFHEAYVRTDADRNDFRYAPLIAEDLSDLAPAFVIVGEYDPLRDEGVAYAERMQESGVAVELQEYKGMFHPFVSLAGILDQGKVAISASAKALYDALYN